MALTPQPIRAVAFDLDGLMFNTEKLYVEVAERMLEKRGHRLDMDLIHAMMGRPARDAFPIMIAHYQLTDTIEQLEQETRETFDSLLPKALQPMPGLLALIDALDRLGIPKGIATSSTRIYLEKILQLSDLPTDFVFHLTSDDVIKGKPDPEVYLAAAQRFGVTPSEMLVLEDSETGCRAAVASGAVTIAVPGTHNRVDNYPDVFLMAKALDDERIIARISG